jgi:hypothetical protein
MRRNASAVLTAGLSLCVLEVSAFTYTDSFNGSTLDPAYWSGSTTNGNTLVLDTTNHRVVMTQVAVSGSSGLNFDKCQVTGNFDVRVDYTILNPPPLGPSTQERIALGASTIGVVQRLSDWWFGGDVYLTDFQSMLGSGSAGIHPWPGIATTDMAGSFRLTRDAAGITGHYANGSGWVTVYNVPTTNPSYYAGPVTVSMAIWNGYSAVGNGMQIAFDNFYLDAPTSPPCGPAPPPSAPADIPTLTDYGKILLAVLMAGCALFVIGRRRIR